MGFGLLLSLLLSIDHFSGHFVKCPFLATKLCHPLVLSFISCCFFTLKKCCLTQCVYFEENRREGLKKPVASSFYV